MEETKVQTIQEDNVEQKKSANNRQPRRSRKPKNNNTSTAPIATNDSEGNIDEKNLFKEKETKT